MKKFVLGCESGLGIYVGRVFRREACTISIWNYQTCLARVRFGDIMQAEYAAKQWGKIMKADEVFVLGKRIDA